MGGHLTKSQHVLGVMIIMVGGLVFFWVTSREDSANHKDINTWAQEHNLTVQHVDHRYLSHGPYQLSKKSSIYRVETDKGVYWFKYNPGRSSVVRENSGEYDKVE